MNNKIVCNTGCKDVVLPASFRRPCPLIQLNSWNELCGRPLRHGPEIKAAKQLFSHLKSFAIYTLSAWNLLCKVVLLPLTPRCGNYRHRPLAKLQNFLSINSRGVGGGGYWWPRTTIHACIPVHSVVGEACEEPSCTEELLPYLLQLLLLLLDMVRLQRAQVGGAPARAIPARHLLLPPQLSHQPLKLLDLMLITLAL